MQLQKYFVSALEQAEGKRGESGSFRGRLGREGRIEREREREKERAKVQPQCRNEQRWSW